METSQSDATKLDPTIVAEDGGSARLPAGLYYVGDPGYVASDADAWEKWVDLTMAQSNNFDRPVYGANLNGHPIVAANTAYGDGDFMDQTGRTYPVDSGCIGLVPFPFLEENDVPEKISTSLGHLMSFESEVTISYSEGVISITSDSGNKEIHIDTSD